MTFHWCWWDKTPNPQRLTTVQGSTQGQGSSCVTRRKEKKMMEKYGKRKHVPNNVAHSMSYSHSLQLKRVQSFTSLVCDFHHFLGQNSLTYRIWFTNHHAILWTGATATMAMSMKNMNLTVGEKQDAMGSTQLSIGNPFNLLMLNRRWIPMSIGICHLWSDVHSDDAAIKHFLNVPTRFRLESPRWMIVQCKPCHSFRPWSNVQQLETWLHDSLVYPMMLRGVSPKHMSTKVLSTWKYFPSVKVDGFKSQK